MSDKRIRELESQIGDLENERGYLYSDKEEAEDTIRTVNDRLSGIRSEIDDITDELNNEPFDEPV